MTSFLIQLSFVDAQNFLSVLSFTEVSFGIISLLIAFCFNYFKEFLLFLPLFLTITEESQLVLKQGPNF